MDPEVVVVKKSDPKCQKSEIGEENCDAMSSSSSSSSSCNGYSSSEDSLGYTSEDSRLFEEEHKRSGSYDFDASRVGAIVVFHLVVFEESYYATEPETDGELMARLSRAALEKYNNAENKKLEFVRAVKANWSLGGGHIFSITFEAKDPSSSSDTIPFHAKVGWIPLDTRVYDVKPKT
ncbi:unnamed protein product [Microthlaspi erraticum]|uniref:Cystatin domain-containing protein n=1 Tax=Microthlaspi erraticum TaxID=1685480 RepID=A0A6D2KJK5_9BRAS|nr:unnamed protein product [Microthlaspi erraticum]